MTDGDVAKRWTSEAVAESYDAERFSGLVGRWFNRASMRALGRCLKDVGSGMVFTDVPCGTGRMFPVLSGFGSFCVAADASPAMMAKAKARPHGAMPVSFVCADARSLPIRDAAVDAVVSVRFVMHLAREDREAVLREFARVSRRWVIVEYGYDSRWHRARQVARRLLLWLIRRPRTYPKATAERQIHEEAHQAGLVVKRWSWTMRILSQSVFVVMENASI